MVGSWTFRLPTRIEFGAGRFAELPDIVTELGHNVLLLGYADRSGLEQAYVEAYMAEMNASAPYKNTI